jgi:hypothetical protein
MTTAQEPPQHDDEPDRGRRSMKGALLLEAVNRCRHALGFPVISGVRVGSCEHDARVGCVECAIAQAMDCSIGVDLATGRYELQFTDRERVAQVAESLGDGNVLESGGVAAPEALDSLLIADAFGLIFRGQDGCLKGWIEPTDDDQSLWDLFLMPGYVYPPGSEPEAGLVRETVFDSTSYLRGLDEDVKNANAGEAAPVALFVAGGPLSGKTTVFERLRADGHDLIPENAVVVDPKTIRGQLPEWEQLHDAREPAAAEMLYEECCDVATQLVGEAIRIGANLVIDGVGARGDLPFSGLLQRFGGLGYEVRVLLVDAPTETAQLRNLQRAECDGLLIDREVLAQTHRAVSADFDDWKDVPARWEMYAGTE